MGPSDLEPDWALCQIWSPTLKFQMEPYIFYFGFGFSGKFYIQIPLDPKYFGPFLGPVKHFWSGNGVIPVAKI